MDKKFKFCLDQAVSLAGPISSSQLGTRKGSPTWAQLFLRSPPETHPSAGLLQPSDSYTRISVSPHPACPHSCTTTHGLVTPKLRSQAPSTYFGLGWGLGGACSHKADHQETEQRFKGSFGYTTLFPEFNQVTL